MSAVLHTSRDPYVLEFEIGGLPKTTNAMNRAKWQTQHAHAKKWYLWVATVAVHFVPEIPFKKAKLTLTRCSSKETDFDGLVSSFKAIIDSLVKLRIIEDDKMSNIGQPEYHWESAPQRKGKIRVKVEGI